jgi:hypothetical protein
MTWGRGKPLAVESPSPSSPGHAKLTTNAAELCVYVWEEGGRNMQEQNTCSTNGIKKKVSRKTKEAVS